MGRPTFPGFGAAVTAVAGLPVAARVRAVAARAQGNFDSQGESDTGRFDSLYPGNFKYTITSRAVPA